LVKINILQQDQFVKQMKHYTGYLKIRAER